MATTKTATKAAESTSTGLNIVQRIDMASKLIKPVGKDGTNNFAHYSFQSEAAIKAAVKPALEAAGLSIIPKYEIVQQYDRKSNKGGTNHFVDVLGTFQITDGHSSLYGSMPGSGQDTGEKATVKAATVAQKYFLKQLFNISDQETDPDAESIQNAGEMVVNASRKPQQAAQAPQAMAEQKDIDAFKQLAQEHAAKNNANVKAIYQQAYAMAKVPRKAFDTLTAAEMLALSKALAQLMG